MQPKIGFPLTASVTDLDGGVMGITWEWERDVAGTADQAATQLLYHRLVIGKMP